MFGWIKRFLNRKAAVHDGIKTLPPRENRGPTDRRYLRREFPNSVFTQRMTKARRKKFAEIMRTLRPEQRAAVKRFGWDKR